jgi:hypothetical protein
MATIDRHSRSCLDVVDSDSVRTADNSIIRRLGRRAAWIVRVVVFNGYTHLSSQ